MANLIIRLPDEADSGAELFQEKGGLLIPATERDAAEIREAIQALVDHARSDPGVAAKGERLMALLAFSLSAFRSGGAA